MNKKLLILLVSTGLMIEINSAGTGTEDDHWEAIASEIADVGNPDDEAELQAAIQAWRNIKDDANAKAAAKKIIDTWKTKGKGKHDELDKQLANKDKDSDLRIKRYPEMGTEDIKLEAQVLLDEKYKNFINDQKMTITITEKAKGKK